VGKEDRCEIDAKRSWFGEPKEKGERYLAGKRNEMMFTETVDGDFPDQDHLVMIFGEDGVVDNVCQQDEKTKGNEIEFLFLFIFSTGRGG